MRAATFIILTFLLSCSDQANITEEYRQEIEKWKKSRLEALVSEDGYVNLAGLYWLAKDSTTFGASEENTIRFPEKSPDYLGALVMKNDSVWLAPAPNIDIKLGDRPVTDRVAAYVNEMQEPAIFSSGSLRWMVIRRGEKYGIRLRDLKHPNLSNLAAIEYYPLDAGFKVLADYEPYDPPKMVKTTNVLGMTYEAKVPGFLTFELKGKKYRLEPNIDEGQLHIRFRDETTGKETYGLGRYLKAEMPTQKSKVSVDFNKAYNPPCAFTEFATCPLPPEENYIDLKVEAGEKTFGEH